MAVTGTSSLNVQRNIRGITAVLTSVACEWFLIFLLFVDAVLSYLLTKFARYCDLQTPCLLCSRLDHVLGNEKPEFYRSLLCSNHRLEISSLISCQIHGKLVDGHGMCEDCLLSFATKNKPNSDTHMLLLGKLGLDGFQSPLPNKDLIPGPITTRPCSCCNKLWSSRQNAQRLFQVKSTGSGVTKPNVPLPRLPGRNRLNRRDSLKKIRDKFYGSVTSHHLGNSGFDSLSHVGYTELKITSDSESEFPFSDDDDGSSVVQEKNYLKGDHAGQRALETLPKAPSDDFAPVKLNHQSFNSGPSLLDTCVQSDVSEPHIVKCLASDVAIDHGLGELNWEQADHKSNPPALPELISVDNIPQASNVVDVPPGVSAENWMLKFPVSQNSNPAAALSELISLDDFPPSFNFTEISVGPSPDKLDVTGTNGIGQMEHGEVIKSVSMAGVGFKTDQILSDPAPSKLDYLDPSYACKSAVNSEGGEASSSAAEQFAVRDPDGLHEDLKHLDSQISSDQETDLLSNDTSPRVHGHHDELQITKASSSNGMKMLQKLDSMERNDSGLESLDGSLISEIEGESVVDRLKRQVEYDRKCMSALYKELEEERSASTIAANQAMAMITRLQEEKAALHMEALQYLRMMEEQAEYDVEALEKANDLLAEKEKEIQDLEADLEFYRNQFPDELMVENIHDDTCDLKGETMMVENTSVLCVENEANVSPNSMTTKASKESDKSNIAKTAWLKLEDEKFYISQCLKKLERKLHQFSGNGASADIPNGGYSENGAHGVNSEEEFLDNEGTQVDCHDERKWFANAKGFFYI
ncbi:hypothetical protein L1049_005103 [Liquidambar formosana]|uniref:GTD-binding domain-containing protein n=1 Tax=Liquidambar formosana TaxID=63359 RepID=A0AAP0WYY2_LIQFO